MSHSAHMGQVQKWVEDLFFPLDTYNLIEEKVLSAAASFETSLKTLSLLKNKGLYSIIQQMMTHQN